jgi:hypothetical protein
MRILVSAIAFHPPGTATWSVPIRQNESIAISVPEWTRGAGGPSKAAYVRDQLPPVIPIVARFATDQPGTFTLTIRAVVREGDPAFVPQPAQVTFANGDSGWGTLTLDTAAIQTGGVKRSNVKWGWQYHIGSGDWTDFDETSHQFYILLSTPTAPWTVLPDSPLNVSLPWTEVLDIACEFAKGTDNRVDAASQVTKAVFALGDKGLLSYDAEVGAPHYTVLGVPHFLCTAFLERLSGQFGAGPLVNCSDCGTIVSTLANALGTDLWQSKMGMIGPGFKLNPFLAIGSDAWLINKDFGFHEVAWTGDCFESDSVYDACLKIDSDENPAIPPQTPNLPVHQTFGSPGQAGTYRAQIAAFQDQQSCAPQPTLRIRRPVSARAVLAGAPLPESALRSVEARLASPNLEPDAAASRHFAIGFHFSGSEFQDWSLGQVRQLQTAPESHAPLGVARVAAGTKVTISWWHSKSDADTAVRIDSFDAPSPQEAAQTLLRIVADIEIPQLERLPSAADKAADKAVDKDGGAMFQSPNGALGLLLRGNQVHVVRPASKKHVNVLPLLQRVDEMLTSGGAPLTPEAVLLLTTGRVRTPVTGWIRLETEGASIRRENGVTRVRSRVPGARILAFHAGPPGPNA